MPTTAGTLRFAGFVPPYEATLVKNLREAGAIILAKTVMTEMANWMVIGMPNNYSSLGGYAFNPYDPRRDPRPGLDDGAAGARHRQFFLGQWHRAQPLGR
jgi:amidase